LSIIGNDAGKTRARFAVVLLKNPTGRNPAAFGLRREIRFEATVSGFPAAPQHRHNRDHHARHIGVLRRESAENIA
jgi:hypothetical protein